LPFAFLFLAELTDDLIAPPMFYLRLGRERMPSLALRVSLNELAKESKFQEHARVIIGSSFLPED
jgi:hypothetical protein